MLFVCLFVCLFFRSFVLLFVCLFVFHSVTYIRICAVEYIYIGTALYKFTLLLLLAITINIWFLKVQYNKFMNVSHLDIKQVTLIEMSACRDIHLFLCWNTIDTSWNGNLTLSEFRYKYFQL